VPVRVYELEGSVPAHAPRGLAPAGFSRLVGGRRSSHGSPRSWSGRWRGRAARRGRRRRRVGKSRVCLEFVERCRAQGIAVHEAHCPSHGAAVPLLPIRELVRSCFTLGADEPEADVRRKVADRLLALELGLDDALPSSSSCSRARPRDVVARSRRADSPRPARGGHATRPARRERRRAGRAAGGRRALDRPGERRRAARTGGGVRGTRTLVLANFRPEYRASWMGGSITSAAARPALSAGQPGAAVDLLGRDVSVGTLFDLIGERTGGNRSSSRRWCTRWRRPAARRPAGGLPALDALETLTIPATVQSLLARVDRSGAREGRAPDGAVIGKQFDEPLLREVVGLDEHALAGLAALQEAEFVQRCSRTRARVRIPSPADAGGRVSLAARRAPRPPPRTVAAASRSCGPTARRARRAHRSSLGCRRHALRARAGDGAPRSGCRASR